MASIRGILNIQSLNELTSEKRNESESPDNERSHSIVTIPRQRGPCTRAGTANEIPTRPPS